MEVDQHGEENHVLRSICVFKDTRLHFEFLNDELQDFAHPKVSIGLSIKEVKCDMDGPNMWHFASVFQSILLNRGEKSADLQLIEEAKLNELKMFRPEILQTMVDKEVKKNLCRFAKKQFSRRVTYNIDNCEFSFYNDTEKFATGNIQGAQGMHMIYSNWESKTDIDVDRVTLCNLVDEEKYRRVL